MTSTTLCRIPLAGALFLAACGGSGPDDDPTVSCGGINPTTLAVGESVIIDATQQGCVRFPAAGAAGAEHLYVAVAGEGGETAGGVTAEYALDGGEVTSAIRMGPSPARASRTGGAAGRFHARLREMERELAGRAGGPALSRAPTLATQGRPPVVGEQRTFKVCETPSCETFVDATATVRVVAQRVAIYLDNDAPTGGYTDADLQLVADLFDTHLYPIDTTAFGRESDLDANGVVVVLLTQRINELSPNCNTSGSVILGYFFGLDLLPGQANSNDGEIFYGLVPNPDDAGCSVSKEFAFGFLPPVFIHEFQHMISFNQHVLQAGSLNTEDTWLNEGLSHYAEELGGRLVPDADCQPLFDNCESQFISGNLDNAFEYLVDPEASFLVEPQDSQGELAERGANWLFVRWLVDHFATEQPVGNDFTRRLVQTGNRGSANVEAETGEAFADLVATWQLANYTEDLANFTPLDDRLQYTSWALRDVYQANFEAGVYDKPYPLTPPVTSDGAVGRSGVLRGGSGVHLRVVQPPAGPALELKLTDPDGTSPVSPAAQPRIGLVRIR
ncbi:MAG TPA: hypothetical protein VFT84_08490 [Gemmatimonadales bacterium]|nr:hypothetical protein [Gemmatimonadales bacterium]